MKRTAVLTAVSTLFLAAASSATETSIPLNIAQLEMNPCTKEPMVLRLNGKIDLSVTSTGGTSRYNVQIHARGTSYGQTSGAEYAVVSESSRALYYGGPQKALVERQKTEFAGSSDPAKYAATFLYRLVVDADGRLTGATFSSAYACK